MKRLGILNRVNVWVAILLVGANIFTWIQVLTGMVAPYVVDPIRDQEVVELLNYIYSGEHSGESWEVTLTELEAEQTITWYLHKYPQIPFAYPQVEITPDYIAGEGDAIIGGLRIHVGGKVRVTLKDGLPEVDILSLSLPLPPAIQEAIEAEIQVQLGRAELLPVRFTSAEWGDSVVIVRGTIR